LGGCIPSQRALLSGWSLKLKIRGRDTGGTKGRGKGDNGGQGGTKGRGK
jgi:hypothetical protein